MQPTDYLNEAEIKMFNQKSDWLGLVAILGIWGWIIAALMLVAFSPNVFTILIALLIIGGKQLGCAIIMHDCSHRSLFKNKKLNKLLGNWLGAYPIWQNVEQYRPYHLLHHRSSGTSEDPDLKLALNYPTTLKSFLRKLRRDLTGVSGVKGFYAILMMHLGYIKYNLAGAIEKTPTSRSPLKIIRERIPLLIGPITFHSIFGILLVSMGFWYVYAVWWVAYLTTYQFSIRIRSMSEHSMTPDLTNPQLNVRTTKANFIEKMLFAPLNVNYHAEHHLLMNVPAYHLPKMHQLLQERGYYKEGIYSRGYWSLIKQAVRV